MSGDPRKLWIGITLVVVCSGLILYILGRHHKHTNASLKPTLVLEATSETNQPTPPTPTIIQMVASIRSKIYDIATAQLNLFLSKPLHTHRCTLEFDDLDVSKCFNFTKHGVFGSHGKVVDSIEKSGCYAGCYALEAGPREICCHLPIGNCGDCVVNYCKHKCGAGLANYTVTIPKLTGLDKVTIDSIDYVGFVAAPNDGRTLQLDCVLSFVNPIRITAHVSLGGDITILGSLSRISQDYDVIGTVSRLSLKCNTQVHVTCANSTMGIHNVTLSDVTVDTTQNTDKVHVDIKSTAGLESLTSAGFAHIATAIVNDIGVMWNNVITHHVIPTVRGELDKQLSAVTHNLVEIQGPYCNI